MVYVVVISFYVLTSLCLWYEISFHVFDESVSMVYVVAISRHVLVLIGPWNNCLVREDDDEGNGKKGRDKETKTKTNDDKERPKCQRQKDEHNVRSITPCFVLKIDTLVFF